MNKKLFSTFILILLQLHSIAQNGSAAEYRVLVVGDSWADFIWADRSLRQKFAAEGRGDVWEKGDVTAISGTTAAQWSTPAYLQKITDELSANPGIHLIQLTIGGNDFLAGQSGNGWYLAMDPEQETALLDRVAGDTLQVIQHIQALNPSLGIVLSYYDYPNFEDSLGGPLGFFCGDKWDDMGNPTTEQLNLALIRFLDRVGETLASLSGVSMVSNLGLMQAGFGFPELGIAPGQIEPPGDPSLPSPARAMRFGGFDCIHIGSTGNSIVASNLWDQFYAQNLCLPENLILLRQNQWPDRYSILQLLRFRTNRCVVNQD